VRMPVVSVGFLSIGLRRVSITSPSLAASATRSASVGVTSSNSWFSYPGSTATNQVIITIDPTRANVYYRLHVAL